MHSSGGIDMRAVAVGTGFALAASLVAATVAACVVGLTAVTETYLPQVLYVTGLALVALGAAVGARQAGRLGWVHGGLVGLSSMAVAALLIGILYPGTTSLAELAGQGLLAFLTGCVGGVLGVNL